MLSFVTPPNIPNIFKAESRQEYQRERTNGIFFTMTVHISTAEIKYVVQRTLRNLEKNSKAESRL